MKSPIKISKRGLEAFKYYSERQDSQKCLENCVTLYGIKFDEQGYSAAECFYNHETHGGDLLPCREPLLLAQALQGKAFHGITIDTMARGFVLERIVFSREIKENYPAWISKEIFAASKKLALKKLGWIPTFVQNERDFSELESI